MTRCVMESSKAYVVQRYISIVTNMCLGMYEYEYVGGCRGISIQHVSTGYGYAYGYGHRCAYGYEQGMV